MGKKTKLGKRRKDRFYHLAKESGYRARSAFKLIQLNRKYQFLQESRVVVDLCAAPGGWLQVAANFTPLSSVIIGVDLVHIKPIANVVTLQEDITTDKCRQSLQRELKTWKADCVLHDGAPNVGSSWVQDAYAQAVLTLSALKLMCSLLRQGGWFITKVFRSKDYQPLMWVLKQLFTRVHSTKPQASRIESAEIFVVCKGFLAPDKVDPKLLDPKHIFSEVETEEPKKAPSLQQLEVKRKAATGYEEGSTLMYKEVPVADFVMSEECLPVLASASCLKFDKQSSVFLRHPLTSDEVRLCCEDIRVLGQRELKTLLAWRRKMRVFLKEVGQGSEGEGEGGSDGGSNRQEEANDLMEGVDETIESLREAELADVKRRRKRLRKKLQKGKEKLALHLAATEGNQVGLDHDFELFQMATLKSKKHLSDIGDADMDRAGMSSGSEEEGEEEVSESESSGEDSEESSYGSEEGTGGGSVEEEVADSTELDELGNQNEEEDGEEEEEEQGNPLVVKFPEEREAASKSRQAHLWFSREVFAGLEGEEDEEQEVEQMLQHFRSSGGVIVGEQRGVGGKVVCAPVVTEEGVVDAGNGRKHSVTDHHGNIEGKLAAGDSDSDLEYSPDRQRGRQGGGDTEVAPATEVRRKRRLDPEGLALASLLVSSKKTREELIDSSFNRWTHDDEGLPDWFVEDESKHCQKQLPITKDMVLQYRQRLREINARPIKKVAEAKARKKKRLLRRMEKAKKRAEVITDAENVSEKEKAEQLRTLYKKAGLSKKRQEVKYVVAKKGLRGKRVPRPPGVSGPYKVVDRRQKKDNRSKTVKKRAKRKGNKRRR